MVKKLYNKVFKKKQNKRQNTIESMGRLGEALHPTNGDVSVVYEEVVEYKIKNILFKLGDKVITRSNECEPLMIGHIVEFWDNGGKWSNCIPQIKDENGKIWGVMGHIKPYTEELIEILKPMKALEQWNYLIPDHLKDVYSYSEEKMIEKEKQYKRVQKNKETLV